MDDDEILLHSQETDRDQWGDCYQNTLRSKWQLANFAPLDRYLKPRAASRESRKGEWLRGKAMLLVVPGERLKMKKTPIQALESGEKRKVN